MAPSDIQFIIQWWTLFFIIGIFFFPFTSLLFSFFADKGYLFAKVIGMLILSYVLFLLGTIRLVPFTTISALCVSALVGSLFLLSVSLMHKNTLFFLVKRTWKIIIVEECLFILTLFFWSYIRLHQPDIHGLEKYMDFGFVNSIGKSTYFPPKDMWFTPYPINYYFFGHFITAVLTKVSGIPSFITYNLMLSTLFAFAFTLSYAIIINMISFLTGQMQKGKAGIKMPIFTFLIGVITASLVSLGGNLHILYIFFNPYKNESPVPFSELTLGLQTIPNAYWYPNATRFIYNTIHEFPIYSFVVSDLHGHVLSIPIILTILAFLLQIFISKKIHVFSVLFLAFLLSSAYMTNAWDGAIYLLLSLMVLFFVQLIDILSKKTKVHLAQISFAFFKTSLIVDSIYYGMVLLAAFFIFSLPFSLFFQTAALVKGIGILCAPKFLTNMQHLGPFIFEVDHCQKSPFWQLFILYGFFYFFVFSFILFLSRVKKIIYTDIFILLVIFIGSFLIFIPEFFYIKDIYPAHYRANTMFKLTYEAFIMLSLVSGYIIARLLLYLPQVKTLSGKISNGVFILISILLISLVLLYPSFAINSYYNNLSSPKSLNGTTYLKQLHPGDYEAITWLNKTIQTQVVIAEAQGDSYTDFARISSNTGLPTILGWTVHEWLWRGSYDIPSPRIEEIKKLYETKNLQEAKTILKKYNVALVYVGALEKEKYPKVSENKFKKLGKVVYKKGDTTIYKIF